MRAAWASWPGICVPLPSHHGHVTCDGLPPRLEMTWPVPRHGAQGAGAPGGASSGIGHRRLTLATAVPPARRARLRSTRCPAPARRGVTPPTAPAATGRYAPSPTGTLHLGNLRTALLAWLFARSQGARFLMRIDDLDRGRVRPGVAEQQLADLAALGLDWDGPVVRQSERVEHYAAAIARLDADGALYPCFCTRAEIRQAASAPHGALPEGSYPGTCRELTRAERAAREASGRPPALRLRAGAATVAFTDRLLGRCEGVVDDLVVRRNDGVPAYNLAVVVDDTAAGRRGGRARRGPRRDHAAPAARRRAAGAARARLRPRPARARRPTARAWPSATAR